MRKIVINDDYGGFGLSTKALSRYNELSGENRDYSSEVPRDSPYLIKVIEEMGKEANGAFADLKIVSIPDDVKWIVEEYDGLEWIAEKHRIWR